MKKVLNTKNLSLEIIEEAKKRLIFALDVKTLEEAIKLLDILKGKVQIIKVNYIAYAHPEIVDIIKQKGFDVWRDFKHHDIPRSAKGFVASDVKGSAITTVHTLGGLKMMQYVASLTKDSDLKVLAVTILTSHDQASLNQEVGIPGTIKQNVVRLALMAERAGLDIVCSAKEAKILRGVLKPDTIIVTPGIKPVWAVQEEDQKRVKTPTDAIKDGANYVVVGSAIYKSKEPVEAVDKIITEIAEALIALKNTKKELLSRRALFMSEVAIKEIFRKEKAIILGDHFVYNAGNHGSAYIGKARIFLNPAIISSLGFELAYRFINDNIDIVVGPVVGGVILSQWTAYHLSSLSGRKVLAIFADKDGEEFVIKRGYNELLEGKNVLVVEDIVTTGGSIRKVIEQTLYHKGKVVGLGVLCNRGNVSFSVPKFEALLTINLESWDEKDCPLCIKGVPINTEFGKGRQFLARQQKS